MNDIDLGEEDGFVNVTFGGTTLRLDVFDTSDRFNACFAKEGASDEETGKALIAVVKELGYPEPSRRIAVAFCNAITAQVKAIKKKPSDPAPSPDSITSIPAP